MKKLRIFVASPGDVSEERDVASLIVSELRRTIGDIRDVELEAVRWETHTWPDIGADAQDVINREIGEFDVFVGIMWKRFGTPTNRSSSGTGEEFDRAYDFFTRYGRPRIMFYFRKTPFYITETRDWSSFEKSSSFRKKLEKLGAFFWEYNEPLSFERALREHLTKQILELTEPEQAIVPVKAPTVFLGSAREDSDRVEPIYKALKAEGFLPWLDVQDLLPGQSWKREIRDVISRVDFCLLFVSRFSVTKRGYVQREMRYALDQVSNSQKEQLI